MTLAIKKIFPKFYKISKRISNNIPMTVKLWNDESFRVNFRIRKMINEWKYGELKEEADIVYNYYNGGDLIDIGSFNSFYSFLLSPKANENDNFISCEPNPKVHNEVYDNFSFLKKKFNYINYSLVTLPIGNGGEAIIEHDEWGHPCFLSTNQSNRENYDLKKKFKSLTIDDLVSSKSLKPTFIKIDTEGAELDVLEGMKETLKIFKPKIMLEKHPNFIPKKISIKMIDDLLKKNNYKSNFINKNNLTIREIWH